MFWKLFIIEFCVENWRFFFEIGNFTEDMVHASQTLKNCHLSSTMRTIDCILESKCVSNFSPFCLILRSITSKKRNKSYFPHGLKNNVCVCEWMSINLKSENANMENVKSFHNSFSINSHTNGLLQASPLTWYPIDFLLPSQK